MNNLKRRPLAVPTSNMSDSTGLEYGVINYMAVKNAVFQFLYHPYAQVSGQPSVASQLSFQLSEIGKGNGMPMWNALKGDIPSFRCSCPPGAPRPLPYSNMDAGTAIMCGDGHNVVDDSIDEFEDYLHLMNSTFAELWPWRMHCK